ncbi:hypothetical protein [Frankia sp. R43]|uniref:hypothetical protein n=1 Tax=Frankia sp. R43 TaxID=269536 RepID=UPI00128E9EA2|nr:hypothetical protein [Frankia sp. R43]
MRVTALNDTGQTSQILTVSTGSGKLQGVWMGNYPMRAGEEVDVELEIRRPRYWSDLVLEGRRRKTFDGAENLVRGRIAEVFADGTVVLRIGTSIVLLEMIDDPPREAVGTSVLLRADDLEFYPTGI